MLRSCSPISFKHVFVVFVVVIGVFVLGATANNIPLKYKYHDRNITKWGLFVIRYATSHGDNNGCKMFKGICVITLNCKYEMII